MNDLSKSKENAKEWEVIAHPCFLSQLKALKEEVKALRKADSVGYKEKKQYKLLVAIYRMGFEIIKQNPADPMFIQGKTLVSSYKHWFRGKFFDGRYRLFFRYNTKEKLIVLAWVNDSESLRTYGAKTDAYSVFSKMLQKGYPPDDWKSLVAQSRNVGTEDTDFPLD